MLKPSRGIKAGGQCLQVAAVLPNVLIRKAAAGSFTGVQNQKALSHAHPPSVGRALLKTLKHLASRRQERLARVGSESVGRALAYHRRWRPDSVALESKRPSSEVPRAPVRRELPRKDEPHASLLFTRSGLAESVHGLMGKFKSQIQRNEPCVFISFFNVNTLNLISPCIAVWFPNVMDLH
ncbi:hypothetical protein NL676_026167 [Syzygium grande]|nr:hypothetical protein NL676_026167 [Syzygium grande]